MRDYLNIAKALSEENRVRTLMLLRNQELCSCHIMEMLELSKSTVSKHMSILVNAGLLKDRKAGRWRYYKLTGKEAPVQVRKALEWLKASLKENKIIIKDANKLTSILKKMPMSKCREC